MIRAFPYPLLELNCHTFHLTQDLSCHMSLCALLAVLVNWESQLVLSCLKNQARALKELLGQWAECTMAGDGR